MQTSSRTELPMTASSSGCGCCSTEAPTVVPAPTDVEYGVEGLTCGGCVARVERAVNDLEGVDRASVEFVPGGISRLVIRGAAGRSAVKDALSSVGYSLANS
ncbi:MULTISPECIES: heavy-metal-associated domain-containing protein [unclassified Arthrobacter]|uniref:heavy-metal-associated domain-containing protein n=1 Tax=unclassified Arthrobacter TaxID=235627 RepID=UPI0028835620|nr:MULTISPECIES: heavy-metal-associated domain-containing protein [unclassified Arthrobacter]